MIDLVARRSRARADLHDMEHDQVADGTPLDPRRNTDNQVYLISHIMSYTSVVLHWHIRVRTSTSN